MRTRSPKSQIAHPGMTVSRSITHSGWPVLLSKRMLFSLQSLCVGRTGKAACLARVCHAVTRPWSPRAESRASFARASRLLSE